eukprot:2929712-Pyramimonas_sp.AAC.1
MDERCQRHGRHEGGNLEMGLVGWPDPPTRCGGECAQHATDNWRLRALKSSGTNRVRRLASSLALGNWGHKISSRIVSNGV